jgi:NADPH-dependent glutamate synthase beta subunit-like oxidoreductase/ferredoxin
MMGRVCPHPCESGCSRGEKDGPVAVHALERFLGDWALESGLRLAREPGAGRLESVGVVGGGPAGLSFAHQMARRGYRVTIYERSDRLGGMLLHGIPEYRLPERVLEGEIARILDLGVEARLGVAVGSDIPLEELRSRHAALFVAIGAHVGRRLDVPGDDAMGVLAGTEFLAALNAGSPPALGSRVVVVGGGNTAMDAARAARRLGAQVVVLYRRTRAEMPAIAEEVDEALREGVVLVELAAPVRVAIEDGRAVGLETRRMRLGEPDASGRRAPVPTDAAPFVLPADTVIAAVSQEPDWGALPELRPGRPFVEGDAGVEIAEGVWAGGDARGLGIAALAIAHGRAAAEAVHRRLRGLDDAAVPLRPAGPTTRVKPEYYGDAPRVQPPVASVEARLAEPDLEPVGTLDAAAFLDEVARCFSCGLCFGCQRCWTYCSGGGFTRVAEPRPGTYFALALDRCESCGKCVDLCPCGYLSPGADARLPT